MDNHVYVSEYNAPEDFVSIYQKDTTNTIAYKLKTNTEQLFVYKNGLSHV